MAESPACSVLCSISDPWSVSRLSALLFFRVWFSRLSVCLHDSPSVCQSICPLAATTVNRVYRVYCVVLLAVSDLTGSTCDLDDQEHFGTRGIKETASATVF